MDNQIETQLLIRESYLKNCEISDTVYLRLHQVKIAIK